jgi:hypothetical protein
MLWEHRAILLAQHLHDADACTERCSGSMRYPLNHGTP